MLFENQLLQIGVKSEFRQNLGGSRGQWGEVSGRPRLEEDMEGTQMELCLSPLLPQAACISFMATRPRCSSRTSLPLWSTPETSRLISSRPGPALLLQVCLPGSRETDPDSSLAPLLESLSPWYFSEI